MGEAFSDVVLKLSLQIENQRLDRLDSSAADKSLDDFAKRAESRVKELTSRMQASFDGLRFPTLPSGGGGGRGGRGGGAPVSRRGPIPYDFSGPGFQPADTEPALRLSPLTGADMIGRRSPDDSQRQAALDANAAAAQKAIDAERRLGYQIDQTFLYMERSEGEVRRITAAREQENRINAVTIESNARIAGTLGKVSNAAAIAVVGYRALSQVNGEHVNVLGEWESSLESGAIGVSLISRGVSTYVGLMGKFGVAVGAGGAALAALPLAVAAVGFKMLADANEEASRWAKINQLQDEQSAARMEANMRRRTLAWQSHVDAVQQMRARLTSIQSDAFGRQQDSIGRRIELASDPQEQRQLYATSAGDAAARIRREQERFDQLEGKLLRYSQFGYGGGSGIADEKAMLEIKKEQAEIQARIVTLKQRENQGLEGVLRTTRTITDAKLQELDAELRNAQREDKADVDFRNLSLKEQGQRRFKGQGPENNFRPAAEVGADIAKLQASAKEDERALISAINEGIKTEVDLITVMQESQASRDVFADQLKATMEGNKNIFNDLATFLKKKDAEIAEIRASLGHNKVQGRGY